MLFYLSPWHAATNSNGCRVGVARHKRTFTPFQIHCSFTGTGFALVLPTGNFHFSVRRVQQLNTGKQGGLEPKSRSTKMVMAQKNRKKAWESYEIGLKDSTSACWHRNRSHWINSLECFKMCFWFLNHYVSILICVASYLAVAWSRWRSQQWGRPTLEATHRWAMKTKWWSIILWIFYSIAASFSKKKNKNKSYTKCCSYLLYMLQSLTDTISKSTIRHLHGSNLRSL